VRAHSTAYPTAASLFEVGIEPLRGVVVCGGKIPHARTASVLGAMRRNSVPRPPVLGAAFLAGAPQGRPGFTDRDMLKSSLWLGRRCAVAVGAAAVGLSFRKPEWSRLAAERR
jgi:hypothetical protein